MSTFSTNLRRLLDEQNKSQSDLARFLGVHPSTITFWLQGSEPRPNTGRMEKVCRFFNCTPADLLLDENLLARTRHTSYKEIPLYGEISAGNGFFSDGNITRYIAVDDSIKGDFAVLVRGQSMVNAGINDGDIALLIKDYSPFTAGKIYAVWQTGEELSYLKRVYLQNNRFLLISENPSYAPITVENNEAIIVGELCGIYHKVEQ